jgi:hypothetical protein
MRGMDIIDWFQQRKIGDHTIDISEAKGAAAEGARRADETAGHRGPPDTRFPALCGSCSRSPARSPSRALEDKVIEIDRRDGREDGRITGKPEPCKACGRVNHSRPSEVPLFVARP